jgi:excisionase family DNA binding protein
MTRHSNISQNRIGHTGDMTMESLTYSVDEVAVLLGIARGVAYEAVRDGSIPATRVGRRWLVPRKRFHLWLEGTETVVQTVERRVA